MELRVYIETESKPCELEIIEEYRKVRENLFDEMPKRATVFSLIDFKYSTPTIYIQV